MLWAPWRMSYIRGDKPRAGSCIFCDLPAAGCDRDNLVLASDDAAVVMMNRFPYNNGHLMVAPRWHGADFEALEAKSFERLMERLRGAMAVVREVLRPDGMNVGLNLGRVAGAGIDTHLHWHIVPRWEGDTNFMPAIGETKVMPQHLHATYDQLAPHFG